MNLKTKERITTYFEENNCKHIPEMKVKNLIKEYDTSQTPMETMIFYEEEPDEELYTTPFRVISNCAAINGYVQWDIIVLP